MGYKPSDWMREVDATFKSGILIGLDQHLSHGVMKMQKFGILFHLQV